MPTAPKRIVKKKQSLEERIRELRYLRSEVAGLNSRITAVQGAACKELLARGETSIEVDGITSRVQINTTAVVDHFALREDLTAQQWEAVTSVVFDKKKLEAAIQAGEVPLSVVEKHTTYSESAPFIVTR